MTEAQMSFLEGVTAQPGNLRDAAGTMRDALAETDLAPLRGDGTVVFCGIGASWHALLPAVRALRRAGRRAFAVTAPELATSREAADAYVLISQSGASTETLEALEATGDAPRYVVSAKGDSPLAQSGRWLPLGPRPDTALSTLSYTATLQALGILCEVLAPGSDQTDWEAVAGLFAAGLERHRPDAELLAAQLTTARALDAIAETASLGSAGESSLLAREGLHLAAGFEETRQYLHGPLESVGEGFCCLLFGSGRELQLAESLASYGASACVVTASDAPAPFGAHAIRIPAVTELAAPILQVLPVQLAVASAGETLGLPLRELMRQQPDTKTVEP